METVVWPISGMLPPLDYRQTSSHEFKIDAVASDNAPAAKSHLIPNRDNRWVDCRSTEFIQNLRFRLGLDVPWRRSGDDDQPRRDTNNPPCTSVLR